MADLGKLWFELGVRENVTGELDRIKKEMLAIQQSALLTAQALEGMSNANDKASKSSAKNAEKQEVSMEKVKKAVANVTKDMEKLQRLMDNNKMGANVTAVKKAYNELQKVLNDYQDAQRKGNISSSELEKINARLATARAEAALATQRFTNETKDATEAEKKTASSAKAMTQMLKEQEAEFTKNERTVRDYANTFDKVGESMRSNSRIMSELNNQINSYLSIYAAERFIKSMITIGGEFEKQHIALKSMLGDAQQANEIFSQIKSLAPISPFTFRDLTTYAKQLTAFNVPFEELYDTTKRLSDISAGLGVDMSRLILAYGQVRSASVLRGQELRQFTEAGIPIVQALADKLTQMNKKLVTTGEVFDYISKRKVPFEMVKEILWDLTEEGGRFFNMQMVLSDTLAGKWANLQDSWEIMLSTMANSQSAMGATMKFGVTQITNLVNSLNKLAPMLATGGILTLLGVGGRKGWNIMRQPTAALQKQILDTKRLVAHQIEMNVETSKQTALQRSILATKSKITEEDLVMLMAEGKISNLQFMQVLNARGLKVAEAERLLAAKGYTTEQIKQITNATRLSVLTSKIGSFMKANGWLLAISLLGSTIGYFWNEASVASENASNAADNAAQRYENLKRVLDDTIKKNPISNDELKTEINGIEEALKELDPYLDKFKEAHKQDDMKSYYEALRGELELTTRAYKAAYEAKALFEDLNTHGILEDRVETNFKDWGDSVANVSRVLSRSGVSNMAKIRNGIKELAKTYSGIKLTDENGKELSLENMLRNIFSIDSNGALIEELGNYVGRSGKTVLKRFEEALDSESSSLTTLQNQLTSKLERIKESIFATEKEIAEGSDEYSMIFMQKFSNWIASIGVSMDDAMTVAGDMLQKYGVNAFRATITPKPVEKVNPGGDKDKDKTDTLLNQWKEEFNELKKFYSQYKKWAKDIGSDAALKRLQEGGLFGSMFNKAGNPVYNIEDWEEALKQFRNKLSGGSSDRRKFMLEVGLEIDDVDYDKNHEELQNAAKRISEYISDEVAKYNLFEKIFEKTGDRSFARNAFRDGKVWDDLSRGLANKLADMLGKSVGDIDFDADSVSMEKALESTEGAYELWKKIVDITSNNYTKSLENAADATEKLMNYEEKITKLRAQRAELERRGASNAELIAIDKEIMKQQTEQFENSTDYLRFYSAILSMTTDEAERIGTSIRENLVKQLADGSINADKYLKSMRNITQQIDKARGGLLGNSDFATFVNGGQKGLVDKRWEEMASAAIKVQKAEEDLMKAQEKGSEAEILSAKVRLNIAQQELNAAKDALNISEKQYQQLSDISMIADVVMGALNGLQTVAKSVSDMFDALGNQNAADAWSDIADGIGIVTDTLKPLDGILKNFMSGNISGMVSNALLAPVNLITAPITGIAKLHDKKLNRAIETSVQEVNKLKTAYDNLESSISNRLGGIYGGREYTEMLSNLQKQRSELQKQMQLEDEKKKTDNQKMADYEQSIREMDQQIKDFAKDMADSLYGINVKSWAKELTDAVVGAWIKGEDAAEAFHDKVKDIVADLTKNILTQKIMEAALQPVLDEIIAEMTLKKGQLDEQSIERFADALAESGEGAVSTITAFLEAMKENGMDLTESSSTSSGGLSKGIQGMTEETSNLLASYINAVRADVSVIRMVLETAYGTGEGSMIAQAQLQQLEMIAANTLRNADSAERIESILNAITLGTKQIYIN